MFASNLTLFRFALGAIAVAGMTLGVPHANAKTGTNGWQTPVTISVASGQVDIFLRLACPAGFAVQNGAYFALTAPTIENGFVLTGQGPRIDISTPTYGEWAWNFEWPNGGAPAGSQIVLNVLCKKGAA